MLSDPAAGLRRHVLGGLDALSDVDAVIDHSGPLGVLLSSLLQPEPQAGDRIGQPPADQRLGEIGAGRPAAQQDLAGEKSTAPVPGDAGP